MAKRDRSQSKIACRDFLGLWLLKAQKNYYFLQTMAFKIP